jgi:hypothetical protein
MYTGTTTKPPKKKKPILNGDKLAESLDSLDVEDPPLKSKNLNVIDEFEKSSPKRIANFVVVGKFDIKFPVRTSNVILTTYRAC